MSEQTLVKVAEAAKRLGTSPDTVRRLVKLGELPVVRFGQHGHLRFRSEDIERLCEPRKAAA